MKYWMKLYSSGFVCKKLECSDWRSGFKAKTLEYAKEIGLYIFKHLMVGFAVGKGLQYKFQNVSGEANSVPETSFIEDAL